MLHNDDLMNKVFSERTLPTFSRPRGMLSSADQNESGNPRGRGCNKVQKIKYYCLDSRLAMITYLASLARALAQPARRNILYAFRRHVSSDSSEGRVDWGSNQLSDEMKSIIYDRDFVELKLEDFEELYRDDPSGLTKESIIEALKDYEYIKYNDNGRVPSLITVKDMKELIVSAKSQSSREGYLRYLFKREMAKLADRRQKEASRLKNQMKYLERSPGENRTGLLAKNGDLMYGLWHNSLLPRVILKRAKRNKTTSSLARAALGGRQLILDFSYDELMPRSKNIRSLGEQILNVYGMNRYQYYDDYFDLWFCNLKEDSPTRRIMLENGDKSLNLDFVSITTDCFTNHFDKSKLVYLSPKARYELGEVASMDDIYIIGAYNDQALPNKNASINRATELGIRSARLPIDRYLAWQGPGKSLCVNHVFGIMLEMINGGDWRTAFHKNIPTRKIKPIETVIQEEEAKRLRSILRRGNSFARKRREYRDILDE